MVALSSTETSPDVSAINILAFEKEETKRRIVLGEFLYICDMRQRNLGNVK